jgi:formylglycine-generating enzyme required for sulfatase activity
MARLRQILALWAACLGTTLPAFAQDLQRQGITNAGVCARCHVSSSLEWGISKHSTIAGKARVPDCIGCHGPSKGHVADEQNSVKPDRVARGAAIASLCIECHRAGCPKTAEKVSCENCHHPHALVNPKFDPAAVEEHARQLSARQEAYQSRLSQGERLAQIKNWSGARDAFKAALAESPASRRAKAGILMCERRLNPGIPGFTIVGDQFDPETGLPREIVMDRAGIALVLIPAGSFDMGSDQRLDAKPVHTVSVAAFYLAKVELTQAQWKALMGTNPSFYQGKKYADADRMPVEQVSWEDCQALVREINRRTSAGAFRLPTEAEWEYAARAGSTVPLSAAEVLRTAWVRENSEPADAPPPVRTGLYLVGSGVISVPHPVGTGEPNRWGLYDMLGNVSEWCSSRYEPYPFDAADGRESAADPGTRVVRGANFADFAENADPAQRHSERPDRRLRWNGVRLAFSPPGSVQPATASSAAAP